jgi:hypothetical protein
MGYYPGLRHQDAMCCPVKADCDHETRHALSCSTYVKQSNGPPRPVSVTSYTVKTGSLSSLSRAELGTKEVPQLPVFRAVPVQKFSSSHWHPLRGHSNLIESQKQMMWIRTSVREHSLTWISHGRELGRRCMLHMKAWCPRQITPTFRKIGVLGLCLASYAACMKVWRSTKQKP